ncbi:MAG TPA: M23 family metallopeptidase [Myxococcota bacterium]|nr:M23 family metallopeptidase [Myxococcota bacterium]
MKWFTFPNVLALFFFGAACALLFGQIHVISSQGQQIDELLSENADLRSSLTDTEEKIDALLSTQADIKNFQKDLDRFVKGANFGSIKKFGHVLEAKVENDVKVVSLVQNNENSPNVRLAKIELATERAKFDISSLLHEALQIKHIILKRPTLTPTQGRVSSFFGNRKDPFSHGIKRHYGVDIVGRKGSPIYASTAGKVRFAKRNLSYGNMVEIGHEDDYLTRYAHLDRILVKAGDYVEQGQIIGTMGSSGTRCQGTHLHYEILHKNKQVDPKTFMKFAPPTGDQLL